MKILGVSMKLPIKILITFFAALTLSACATTQQKKVEYLFYKNSGDTLPIDKVIDIQGDEVDLTNSNKRKLVILFATWCSDSQRALKALNQSDILNESDLEIIAIGREDTIEKLFNFKKEYNLTFNLAADPKREIYSKFANAGIPRFIMVDKNNLIIDHVIAEGEQQIQKIHWGVKK